MERKLSTGEMQEVKLLTLNLNAKNLGHDGGT